MKQEYLMLAHTFKPGKISPAGMYISEKLDGVRAYWDGGLSRGLRASEVPYANTVKDDRLKEVEIATGLWSRTGKVIHAPDHWLSLLPNFPLDGELWLGRGRFQELISIVSTKDGSRDYDWVTIRFMILDSPPYPKMFRDRIVKVRDYDFEIKDAMDFYHNRVYGTTFDGPIKSASTKWNFEIVYDWLERNLPHHHTVCLVEQERLPCSYSEAMATLNSRLEKLLGFGAEGVILRSLVSFWNPIRSHTLLKYKPWKDDEATIIGFTSGRETDRGSKLLGMIGALVVDYNGKRLELSGLTDAERQFSWGDAVRWAEENPGKDMPASFEGRNFKIGQRITFKYRELSDDGVPKEARYYRKEKEV